LRLLDDQIAEKFLEYPWLHMFVRALLFSAWFRFSVLLLLLLPILFFASIRKIWPTTPRDFDPAVKISLLDWFQYKSLHRAALSELKLGKTQEGMISFQLALANNPGNADLVREYLIEMLARVKPPEFQGPALNQAMWLMRLTHTNTTDLALACRVFEKYGLEQQVISLLKPREDQLTEELERIYARCLFSSGSLSQFDRFWISRSRQSALLNDVESQLYRSAFLAAWKSMNASDIPPLRLEDFLNHPEHGLLAHRLLLKVYAERRDVSSYLQTLKRLEEKSQDQLLEHITAWRLLLHHGRGVEAAQRASQLSTRPATVVETAHLSKALFELGLRSEAIKVLDQFTLEFSYFDGLWILYANLLQEAQQWDKLLQLALNVRLNGDLADRLGGFSYYLEGRAHLAQNRTDQATVAFTKMAAQKIKNVEVAVATAKAMIDLGRSDNALQILQHIETEAEKEPVYWELLVAVAFDLKEGGLLLKAASKCLDLNAHNWAARNNMAAALLINRQDPARSIKLTFELITQVPNSHSVRINHAQALVQNGRYIEAEALLKTVDEDRLSESERCYYNLAKLDALTHQGKTDQAKALFAKIKPQFLFPVQSQHLKSLASVLAQKT
jgi:predicted Zn-dependent protease